jgi:hypothetical protein
MYVATHYVCVELHDNKHMETAAEFLRQTLAQYPFRVVKPMNGNGIELSYNLLIEAILVSDKKRPAIFTINLYHLIVGLNN